MMLKKVRNLIFLEVKYTSCRKSYEIWELNIICWSTNNRVLEWLWGRDSWGKRRKETDRERASVTFLFHCRVLLHNLTKRTSILFHLFLSSIFLSLSPCLVILSCYLTLRMPLNLLPLDAKMMLMMMSNQVQPLKTQMKIWCWEAHRQGWRARGRGRRRRSKWNIQNETVVFVVCMGNIIIIIIVIIIVQLGARCR